MEWPGGGGAGVVCSFASLAARVGVGGDDVEEERVRSRKSVTRKYVEGFEANAPWPMLEGQSVGTAVWMAFSDSCSPVCVGEWLCKP